MTRAYARNVDLLEADIGDELVALDADAGACFGFNSVASDVWRFLSQARTLDEIEAELLKLYDVDPMQCRSDLVELFAKLTALGLVKERSEI